MVCELPALKEMDINPLILDETGALAADARIIVEYRHLGADRYAHMAIAPYPTHLVSHWQLADGTDIVIRPIRPEDAEMDQRFIRGLSDKSRYFRFMGAMYELPETLLASLTQIDYGREMALIAVTENKGQETALGVARYVVNPDGTSCNFALAVADDIAGKGLGRKLMTSLMNAARGQGLKKIEGIVLNSNHRMLRLMNRLGFESQPLDPWPLRPDTACQIKSRLGQFIARNKCISYFSSNNVNSAIGSIPNSAFKYYGLTLIFSNSV